MNSSADLDLRVQARVRQLSVLVGTVAHQLGATMLPSIKEPTGPVADDRAWKRLAFQTRALTGHVRNQKAALDHFRSKESGDLDAMDGERWVEWVLPMIEACGCGGRGCVSSAQVTAPVELGLTHALLLTVLALDEQVEARGSIDLRINHGAERTASSIGWTQGAIPGELVIPGSLVEAAAATGLVLEVEGTRLHLREARGAV